IQERDRPAGDVLQTLPGKRRLTSGGGSRGAGVQLRRPRAAALLLRAVDDVEEVVVAAAAYRPREEAPGPAVGGGRGSEGRLVRRTPSDPEDLPDPGRQRPFDQVVLGREVAARENGNRLLERAERRHLERVRGRLQLG